MLSVVILSILCSKCRYFEHSCSKCNDFIVMMCVIVLSVVMLAVAAPSSLSRLEVSFWINVVTSAR
jgi:hypothetical protein